MVNENQENFEKKKKIIVISLSVSLVFTTLIAGLFLAKKNKESGFENNDLGEVVNENDSDHENNNNDNDHENDDVIVNEGDYFFNKTSGRVTMNVLLFLVAGILFFLWENDKLPHNDKAIVNEGCEMTTLSNSLCGLNNKRGIGIFELDNWFGFGTLVPLIITTLLVELILQLLIGSISYFFSKDKNKKYLHTLKMFWKKRKNLFSSLSKTKIFFIVLTYLLCGFVIAMIARIVERCHPCCCCRNNGQIITDHGHKCCGFCEKKLEEAKPSEEQKKMEEDEMRDIILDETELIERQRIQKMNRKKNININNNK